MSKRYPVLLAVVLVLNFNLWSAVDPALPQDEVHLNPPSDPDPISYNRDISPILSDHCLECHGPDANKRKADLRLDLFEEVIRSPKSGNPAIVPGNPGKSEMILRVEEDDEEERMPPSASGDRLTREEIDLLKRWITTGAKFQRHWAFVPPVEPGPPMVRNKSWPQRTLDYFILAKLEKKGLDPAPPADRRTLIRRAYFDLIGLPPSPEALEKFLRDTRPNALEVVVEGLLASPQYGERWGRHWLDVARYGDSNGGDENHAYAHAYHYRNYVIDAFNRDLPYDEFLIQQIAGDLMPSTSDLQEKADRLTATGFMAIGTKILAEQDRVKKQADTVDEQIDTFGKSLIGLTLACARCHDHKFDPIPTTDYYALAGIFHSTSIGNQELTLPEFAEANDRFEKGLKNFDRVVQAAEDRLQSMLDKENQIELEAETFDRGNVTVDTSNYGTDIGIISDPGSQKNFVEYDLQIKKSGPHAIQLRYAAASARPGNLLIDGSLIKENAISETTGGWGPEHQLWFLENIHEFKTKGKAVLRIESEPMMSHIDKIRVIPVLAGGDLKGATTEVEAAARRKQEWMKTKPTPATVMAISEGDVQDTKVHLRGSHLSLGDTVPRGVPSRIGAPGQPTFSKTNSGRLELARWLVRPDHPLTSRVMVNRLWRWHMGNGIVGTPNNFGIKGQRPTHPELLDYLALRFIKSGWSIKSMHREIMLSSTYQMSSQVTNPRAEQLDSSNALYWKRDMRRLEAEAFRDSLLWLSGRLETALGSGAMQVKSGDPSPTDLENNQKFYESSRRRTVYLPVVRSNVYDLLTLLDFPNASTPVGNRVTTTVPTQAMMMMNHDYLIDLARDWIRKVTQDSRFQQPVPSLSRFYLEAFGRPPTDMETEWSMEFLENYTSQSESKNGKQDAWTALAQTLLMSNEFVHIQ